MNTKYLSVDEAAKRAGKEDFFHNVKRSVIPRLIKKGLLRGKKEKKRDLVADDDALARVMQLGVEAFVYNQQGYSFSVVHAPIQRVAAKMKTSRAVSKYEENVKPLKMKHGIGVQPDEKFRHAFLVQMSAAPEWSVLIQTVHWFQSCDAVMATALACALSKEFNTLAAAAWDDDFSGSSLIICDKGKQSAAISDESEEDGWTFYEFFYEHGIYLPKTFIGSGKGDASLYVAEPAKVQRADRIALKVPTEVESKGSHVTEKLGMMAEALAEGLEDEEAFMKHMHGEIWEQAEAVLANGWF
jgi:hypothetical protein